MMIDYLETFSHRKLFVLLWESFLALDKIEIHLYVEIFSPCFIWTRIYVYYQSFCIQNGMALINTTGW